MVLMAGGNPDLALIYFIFKQIAELYLQLINLSNIYKETGFYALWFGTHLIIMVTGAEAIEVNQTIEKPLISCIVIDCSFKRFRFYLFMTF